MNQIWKLIVYAIAATTILLLIHCPAYPDGIKNAVLNITQGAYPSSLVVIIFELINEIRLYRRLNILHGDWEECGIENRFIKGVIAKGRIEYKGGNSLYIELHHDNRTWTGEIIINKDHPHSGTISWAYLPDTGQEHEFGLKELIIPTERNKVDKEYNFLYLIPVNFTDGFIGELRKDNSIYVGPYGYGKVIWRKKK